jgi:hypothetical protein
MTEKRVSLALLTGAEVLIGGHVTDNAKWSTLRGAVVVTGGRWYYEVKLGNMSASRIGVCSSDWAPPEPEPGQKWAGQCSALPFTAPALCLAY